MANKKIFKSATRGVAPLPATAVNEAGGRAFSFTEKHALAQYVCTGTFNDAYYVSGGDQLESVLQLCSTVDPAFIAKCAIYAREKGTMKDMPALLAAYLSTVNLALLKRVWPTVVNNGKMLRNFVQILRSGQVGRKSLGSGPKRLVQKWFESRTDEQVFWQSLGNDPSIADVLKLSRPRPKTIARAALYAYLLGQKDIRVDPESGNKNVPAAAHWPELVKQYETFKAAKLKDKSVRMDLPKVPWEMLEGLSLSDKDWENLAKQASWTQTRMNLNTFGRHGVYKNREVVKMLADRLKNPELIEKVRPFPYQLFAAYINTLPERGYLPGESGIDIPTAIRDALQDAVELATKNVPIVQGKVVVCPDVSGSMGSPVTGHRQGATTKMRCIDIAALVASVFLKRNPEAEVLPFEHNVVERLHLNSRDSIMTNAQKLASIGGGGTNCSAPLALLNRRKAHVDLVVFVSDNESWVDSRTRYNYGNTTGTLAEWNTIKARCPKAKMVCIDIQPNSTGQAPEHKDILNIGGFSDAVFDQVQKFVEGTLSPDHWVGMIEAISLDPPVAADAEKQEQ